MPAGTPEIPSLGRRLHRVVGHPNGHNVATPQTRIRSRYSLGSRDERDTEEREPTITPTPHGGAAAERRDNDLFRTRSISLSPRQQTRAPAFNNTSLSASCLQEAAVPNSRSSTHPFLRKEEGFHVPLHQPTVSISVITPSSSSSSPPNNLSPTMFYSSSPLVSQ